MEEILQQLANLQYIDSKIDEIARLRGDLPEEIADIEIDIQRYEHKFKNLDDEGKALSTESNMLKGDIEEATMLIEKYEKQQMSVRNNREYDALTKEIESQKQRVENAHSRLEEIQILLSENAQNLEECSNYLEDTKELLKTKNESLGELQSQTQSEEDGLLKKREAATKELTDRYLRNYERKRKGFKNGLVVVPMERGSCMGMMLPPQMQVDVRKRNKVIIDENSGRIVIDQSFFDQAAKNFNS